MNDLRIKALELAHNAGEKPDVVVKRADAYLAFLQTSTAIVAPTPTASPLAEADGTEPARLDSPKVKAEAAAVIERPTLAGDTASTTSSSVPAESVSQAAPPTEAAPAAASSSPTPPVADVNAAVLAFNRANGREKTLALLGKFGGSKVPEIDASKHADLLAELKAGVA